MVRKKNEQKVLLDLNMAEEAYNSAGIVANDPKPASDQLKKSAQSDYEWERFAFICGKTLVAKVKAIASKEGVSIRELMEYMMSQGIMRYEKKHGTIEVSVSANVKKRLKDLM